MREFKEKGHALVLRGSLNPPIFQPWWFEAKGLIGKNEAEKADIKVVHEGVTDFSLEWVSLQVLPDRLTAATSDESSEEAVRDLIQGAFKLLGHTPLHALGINRTAHFTVDSEAEWDNIGHKLVPKEELWDKLLSHPGMRAVLVEGKREDDRPGHILVRVEPSRRHRFGIFVDINDHYVIGKGEDDPGDGAAVSALLESVWRESMDRSKRLMESLRKDL